MRGEGSGHANDDHQRMADSRRRRRCYMAAIATTITSVEFLDSDTVPRPVHISSLRGIDKVNELLSNNNEAAMFNKVRMGPRAFLILSNILTERGLLRPSNNMNVQEQLFVFLTIVCQSQTNREAQDIWQHSGETIS